VTELQNMKLFLKFLLYATTRLTVQTTKTNKGVIGLVENILSDGEIALRMRGTIVIPDEVKLRIWLMENEKRGLKPVMQG
jgi:hypothetical protein